MRNVILKGAPDAVNFVPEDPNTYLTRMKAELGAAQGKVHVTIALDGELGPGQLARRPAGHRRHREQARRSR